MITYDKSPFDSKRKIDENGYLRAESCNITKTQVAPYLGREIPGWKELGLEAETIYYVLRPEDELKKAAPTFNNLPLTREHIEVDVEDVPKEKIVGSLGDHTEYADGYLKNSLIIYDKKDIDLVMSGKKKELSCGYRYTPVRQHGVYDGKPYDFVMTNIVGNHVALVKEGRAGHDVMVSDTISKVKENIMNLFKKKEVVQDEAPTNEIPQEAEKPVEAREEVASEQGEQTMVEETKQEVVQDTKEEVLAEDKCGTKDEGKDLKGKEKEAFAEGVDYGEKKEKEEPKKLDSEHESEGTKKADEKKAEEKKEAEDEKEEKKEDKKEEPKGANDSAMAMDIDAIKAEAREEGRKEAIEDYKEREVARKSVRSMVGDVDVFAFDSAEDIYKFACEKAGMDLNEIASYKSAFAGLKAAKGKMAMDASSVGSNKECFKDIRLG